MNDPKFGAARSSIRTIHPVFSYRIILSDRIVFPDTIRSNKELILVSVDSIQNNTIKMYWSVNPIRSDMIRMLRSFDPIQLHIAIFDA